VGFLKRLLRREEASEGPVNPFGEGTPIPELGRVDPVAEGSVPPPAPSPVTTPSVETGAVELTGQQEIDLRGNPEARRRILDAMQKHSGDPEAAQAAITGVLRAYGLQVPDGVPVNVIQTETTGSSASIAGGDPLEKLKQLDELRDSGLLGDAEYDAKRKEILDAL
jgi:hypothetical protein